MGGHAVAGLAGWGVAYEDAADESRTGTRCAVVCVQLVQAVDGLLGPSSEIAGNVTAAGGQLRLQGTVKGHVQAAGGRVLIDGPVSGDVTASTGQLELGPKARIAGTLRYRSQEAFVRDPAAQVEGGIEVEPVAVQGTKATPSVERGAEPSRVAGALGVLWALGLIVCAAVLLAALPGFSATVSRTLRQRPGPSVLLGFVILVCLPVAAVIVFVTVIGIPLALLAMALYAVLLPLGYIAAGIGLGDWALERWWPQKVGRTPLRIAAAAAVLVALSLLGWVPLLGSLAGFVALLAGLGALLLQLRRHTAPAPAPATAAATEKT